MNQTFSYRIDGSAATYLGEGDFHEERFNKYERRADVTELITQKASPITRSYTGVDLNGEYCRYTIRVYPSEITEGDYITNKPVYYTIVVGLIFVFTSAIFVLYDTLVERRQTIVLDNANKSGAVVASLFPTDF